MAIWGTTASITLAEMTTRTRRAARTNDSVHTDAIIMDLINEGIREFAKDVHGLWAEEYLSLLPRFDTRTNFAVKVTTNAASASLAITANNRTDATGGTIASDFQTAIQATWGSSTVSWSNTAWNFSVTIPGATSISIAAPGSANLTYVDAAKIIGGGASQSGSVWAGSFPEDCTVETDLPSDFVKIQYAEWDRRRLTPAQFSSFMSPRYRGIPSSYHVKSNRLRLYPVPSRQELLHIIYKASPTEYVDAATQTATVCPLPKRYELAPAYYAASTIGLENFEKEVETKNKARYFDQVRKYILEHANQITDMEEPEHAPRRMRISFDYEG